MEFNASSMPFWEVSQTPMTLSQIADDDFLTLLQKQFPTDVQIPFDLNFPGYNNPAVVNPQSLSDYTFPISQPTPPSSDSGNSPVSTTNDNDDRSLKRKASDERMDVEPASKTAHTAAPSSTTASSGNSKKTNTRRKSGNPTQDELRLMKRKEQNRAAQRAFRERKERHVKDLEDKVSELEMKNQRTESENENLRDLLSRLQEENVQLKKQQQQQQQHQSSPSQPFTFAIPKDSPATVGNNANSPLQKDSPSAPSTGPPQTNFFTPFTGSEFDFGSLIPFDPAVLNALDDTQTSPPASDDVMNLDFGFGKPNRQTFNILASDPAYMSFAEPSPPDSASVSTPMNSINPFDFSALDQWSRSGPRSNSGDTMQTFDELFGGSSNFLPSSSGIDFAELMKKSPSLMTSSPVSHTNLHSNGSGSANMNSPLTPSSTNSLETPHHKGGDGCPKTKEQLLETINKAGLSSFVVDSPGNNNPSTQCETGSIPFLKKSTNKDAPMVMCRGSSFPKTEQNDENIEVLSAWRTITSNPQFKDIDINELCTEFTNKAKCDGTKVVLEPAGVTHIIDTLNAKVQQKAAASAAAPGHK